MLSKKQYPHQFIIDEDSLCFDIEKAQKYILLCLMCFNVSLNRERIFSVEE